MATAEKAIYDRLAAAPTFHPASAALFANDWALDAGDVVAVKSGEDTFSVPIYGMTLDWKGNSMVEIQSTGNEERKPISALKRRQFASGRGRYRQEKEIDGYYQRLIEEHGSMGLISGALGVVLDADGNPVTDPTTGKLVYDENSPAELFSRLLTTPNYAELVSALNNGTQQISGAKINLSSQGSVLIQAINNRPSGESSVTIDADKINLTGYVTATALDTKLANVDKLFTTAGYANSIYAGSMSVNTTLTAGTVQADNFIFRDTGTSGGGDTIHTRPVQLFASGYLSDISALAIGSASTMDLRHYHDIDIEEVTSGENAGKMKVTLGSAVSTSDTTDHIAFFKIADTTTCQNLVSAAEISGWQQAGNAVYAALPSPQTGSHLMLIPYPSSEKGTLSYLSYGVACNNDYAYIYDANDNVVARVANPKPTGTITAVTLRPGATVVYNETEKEYTVPLRVTGSNVGNSPWDSGSVTVSGSDAYNHGHRVGVADAAGITSIVLNGPASTAYTDGTDKGTLTTDRYYQVAVTPKSGEVQYIKFKTAAAVSPYSDYQVVVSWKSGSASYGSTSSNRTLTVTAQGKNASGKWVNLASGTKKVTATRKYDEEYYIEIT